MTKKYVEIYEKIKSDLIDGSIKFGQKLPSKRAAAETFKASVITVEHAYEILQSEGYIEARERSGYFSCYDVSSYFFSNKSENAIKNEAKNENDNIIKAKSENKNENEYFSFGLYASAVRCVLNDYGEKIKQKTPAGGSEELKKAIKNYLKTYRDICVDENQIIIGSGAEYLYGIIAKLIGANELFALESPGYPGIKKVYEQNGVKTEELAMGKNGILTEALAKSSAKVLHVTPYRSYPTGITASAAKRKEYLHFALSRQGFIIEDDYQSEFSLSANLTKTLYGECDFNSVIYVNTFSKTIFPSVRTAYALLPAPLANKFEQEFGSLSCTVPALEQYAIAKIINDGSFVRHLNRVRRARKKSLSVEKSLSDKKS